MKRTMSYLVLGGFLAIILTACSGGLETVTISEPSPTPDRASGRDDDQNALNDAKSAETPPVERELEIITLLPRDGIPAIDNPTFLSAEEADQEYDSDELVIGVEFDGDARAYSIPLLSSHEIVNDTVGGRAIAVTW